MIRLLPLSLIVLFALSSLHCFAFDMGLTPAKVMESLLPGAQKTVVYTLINGSTTTPLRVQVLVYDWSLSDRGELMTPRPGTYPYSASDWVEVSPAEFVVKPRQTQIVRATYRVPADAKAGDYLTALLFRQRVVIPPPKDRMGGQLVPEGLVGSLAYITVPVGEKKPTLESMKFEPSFDGKPSIVYKIKNDGSLHIRPSGNINILDGTGKSVLSQGLGDISVVLRNSVGVRAFPLEKLAAGKYQAVLNIDLDPSSYKFEKGTLDFTMTAAPAAVQQPDKATARAGSSKSVTGTPLIVKPAKPAAAKPAAAKPAAAKPAAAKPAAAKPAAAKPAAAKPAAAKPAAAKPAAAKPAAAKPES